ncbi:hypothetical protein NDA16_005100 [Ustilago loliicola]|nr:hypothetical protein NDA16_005100 [Ustilago loliicola]
MSPGKKRKVLFAGDMNDSLQDREGFACIRVALDSSPRQWEKVLECGWTMTLTYGKGDLGLCYVGLTKDEEAIDCFFDVIATIKGSKNSGHLHSVESKHTTVRLDAGLDSLSFTVPIAEQLKRTERSEELQDSQANDIVEFSYRIRKEDVLPAFTTPPGLVDAIARATVHGTWGDICFVVLNRTGGSKYACVYGDRTTLQAHGATELLRLVDNNAFPTLEAALRALKYRDAPHLPETEQSMRKFVPVCRMAVTTIQAVLLYLQTRYIKFAPLKSANPGSIGRLEDERDEIAGDEQFVDAEDMDVEQGDGSHSEQHLVHFSSMITASPKSLYRAACRFGLTELKELANKAIDDDITPANVLGELFGNFGLQNEEMKAKLLAYTLSHWEELKKKQNCKAMVEMFMERGHRIGAQEVIQNIMEHTVIKDSSE